MNQGPAAAAPLGAETTVIDPAFEAAPEPDAGSVQERRERALEELAAALDEVAGTERADVRLEARLQDDLEIDSIQLLDLMVTCENTLGIRIAQEDIERNATVGEVVDYLMEATERQGRA
jgi:acyl carrier protein